MYLLLAISLAIRSQQTAKKSLNMISAIGRRPVIAAPMAAPRMACSLMGVSRTRRGPNCSSRPGVVLNTPPAAATSSPRKTTLGSRLISWAIPRVTASRYVMTVTSGPFGIYLVPPGVTAVGPHVRARQLEAGLGTSFGLLGGPVDRLAGVLVEFVQHRRVDAAAGQDRPVGRQRIPGQPLPDLRVGPVLARVGTRVAAVPVGERLDERRAAALPGPAERGLGHLVDRLHVVAVHHHRVEAVGGGPVRGGPRHRGHRADRGVLHVLVVLADEDHRQLPHGGQVERLVEGADVGGAVTEEADRDLTGAAVHGR